MANKTRLFALAALLALGGCAGNVERWIVNTRVNQGDVALSRGSLHEAETAYRLALRVNPHDPRARQGFSQASALVAEADYKKGDFDDAMTTLNDATKYDPQSVRLQALRTQIDDAKLKREIVISNYPTYEAAGLQIQTSYAGLNDQTKAILRGLKRFGYTYDSQDLTRAIQNSYELQQEVVKNTNRLIAYRQLVESGAPASAAAAAGSQATGGSLL
ncbi:MAG TPA: tetratricopeptide repeat protein, partial [Candidatus Baltobacteraceae bacterium]|nr:tetratricopeptide repeat protein [Candidatus Baltobacteraceae bacterium]